MSTAEQWYANRNFKGIGTDGKPLSFTRGDPVPDVQAWPTFNSLRNIDWIVPENPMPGKTGKKILNGSAKVTPITKNVTKKKKAMSVTKTTKVKTEVKTEVKATANSTEEKCGVCNKTFSTSRALKVHARYHKA